MLLSLHVKNLALIDETEVFFEPGLNILTGETGAGKSVLIGSINLALGAKAEKDMIRSGADYALVELLFHSEDKAVLAKMEELELPLEEGDICISRRIQPGRSVCRVNGETVSARQIKELAELLIDIHGQHEHQSLLNKKKHMEILDAYAGERLEIVKKEISDAYREYQSIRQEIENSAMDEEEKRRTLTLAEFEYQEIEDAGLTLGEDEQLESDYKKMVNVKRIGEAVSVCSMLSGYDSEGAAGAAFGRALKELRAVAGFDTQLEELEQQLTEIDGLLNDFNRSMSGYMEDLDMDPSAFVKLEERLNQINHLKGKYGNTIEEILLYGQKQQEKLEKLADYDAYMENLQKRKEQAYTELMSACESASAIRKEQAQMLAEKMREALKELSFLSVQFEIAVTPGETPGSNGFDDVEFLISTNPGEDIKPLNQVASGGELSRVMLAIKAVLASKDSIETLIFDEIDTGISGRTAWQVSRQLGILGNTHQVISITHLPQIAAMADVHFCIEKNSDGVTTRTEINRLKEEESIREVARLLGSETITEAAIENAVEMKKMAKETKQY